MAQMRLGPAKCTTSQAHLRPRSVPFRPAFRISTASRHRRILLNSADPQTEGQVKGEVIENPDSEAAKKQAEIDRLRAAEKFMVVGNGEASCTGCGYEYKPSQGDPEFPVAKGTLFQNLPADYICPICGAPKEKFEARVKVVAGFEENQKYGLGTNGMTSDQKQLLIWGTFGLFFLFFIAGYGLS